MKSACFGKAGGIFPRKQCSVLWLNFVKYSEGHQHYVGVAWHLTVERKFLSFIFELKVQLWPVKPLRKIYVGSWFWSFTFPNLGASLLKRLSLNNYRWKFVVASNVMICSSLIPERLTVRRICITGSTSISLTLFFLSLYFLRFLLIIFFCSI